LNVLPYILLLEKVEQKYTIILLEKSTFGKGGAKYFPKEESSYSF
jgi:hypothetical protein